MNVIHIVVRYVLYYKYQGHKRIKITRYSTEHFKPLTIGQYCSELPVCRVNRTRTLRHYKPGAAANAKMVTKEPIARKHPSQRGL